MCYIFAFNFFLTCKEEKFFLNHGVSGFAVMGQHPSLHHSQLSVNLRWSAHSPHAFYLSSGPQHSAFSFRKRKIRMTKLAVLMHTL